MNAKTHFKKHYARLHREAVLKSFLHGLTVGLACGAVSLLALWFTKLNSILISALILAVATAISSVAFYFGKHRPTAIGSARRIDALGLEERVITMIELENEDSVIANHQREDANRALEELAPSLIKLRLSKKTAILLSLAGFFCVAALTLNVLSELGVVPDGNELIDDAVEQAQEVYVSVTYEVEEGGYIQGEADQLVLAGTHAETVRAVAEEGYIFVEWDDGYTDPERTDRNITSDIVFVAIFELIEEDGEDGDEGEDQPSDQPQESDRESSEGNPDENASSSSNTGAKYEERNQIIDGKTYYREVLEIYKEILRERLEQDGDKLTEEEKAIIEAYLGIV